MFPERDKFGLSQKDNIFFNDLLITSSLVKKAYETACREHLGQYRKTGEPYVEHCKEVAKIICNEWEIKDELILSAALLHDTLEDTNINMQQLISEFGEDVTTLVENVSKFRSDSKSIEDKETLKKIVRRSYIDPRVAVIKLADRLHNMRTLSVMTEKQKISKSQETIEVYAKLAKSLGMWEVKIELEDLSFFYINPEGYKKTKDRIESDPRNDELFISYIESNLKELISSSDLKGEIHFKLNGIWAINKKEEKNIFEGKSLPGDYSKVNDLISYRALFKNTTDCYKFLGILHNFFNNHFDEKRFDEFIAKPRENGYSAIQTTLNFPEGAVEVAITTFEREDFNNDGVINLIKKGERNLNQFTLKLVFTPYGIWFLKKEATGIDLAVMCSPERGIYSKSVLINGEKKPLSVNIPNASDVDFIWGNNGENLVDPKLINYALPQTKNILEEAIIQKNRENLVKKGKLILEKILSSRGLLDLSDVPGLESKFLGRLPDQSCDNKYFLIGGGYIADEIIISDLDQLGINKKSIGLTTIKIIGKDKRGVLKNLSAIIADFGGNIYGIRYGKKEKNNYLLRIIIEGLNLEKEESIRKLLKDMAKKMHFNEVVVV